MTDKAQINFEIPEAIVKEHLTAAVIKAIGDPDKLVKAVVDTAMNAKKESYSRTSLFQDQVNAMIRDEATAAFKEWLAEMRPDIRTRIRERISAASLDALADRASETIMNKLASEVATALYRADQE